MTEEEHDHDGGQQGGHGVVSPLVGRGGGGREDSREDCPASSNTFSVGEVWGWDRSPFKSFVDEVVQYCQEDDWEKAHDYAVK